MNYSIRLWESCLNLQIEGVTVLAIGSTMHIEMFIM